MITASTSRSVTSVSQSVVTRSMPCFSANDPRIVEAMAGDADDAAETGLADGAHVQIGDEAAAADGDSEVGHVPEVYGSAATAGVD